MKQSTKDKHVNYGLSSGKPEPAVTCIQQKHGLTLQAKNVKKFNFFLSYACFKQSPFLSRQYIVGLSSRSG
jgi:hypothetical protein